MSQNRKNFFFNYSSLKKNEVGRSINPSCTGTGDGGNGQKKKKKKKIIFDSDDLQLNALKIFVG